MPLFLINEKSSLSSSLFRNLRPNLKKKNQFCLTPKENGEQGEMELVFTLNFLREQEQ